MTLTIQRHLDDATLVAYAAGTLARQLRVIAASHLELCKHCRTNLLLADEVAAALTLDEGESAVTPSLKQAVMSQIDTATVHRFSHTSRKSVSGLPRALMVELGVATLDDIKWRKAGPGIEMAKLPKSKKQEGFFGLLRIQPGSEVPDHGHSGTELTLVLEGAYNDEMGRFAAGDIADLDSSIAHKPVADVGAPCICLVANDAPTRFRSWAARLLQPFIGI